MESLVDSFGRALQVVFPGRRFGGPGPDFQGALIALPDGGLLRGDVEVHRRASDWARHGHAVDARYERVVLHVVHELDAPAVAHRGTPIASVALPLGSVVRFPVVPPCLRDADEVEQIVLEAGRARFWARAARFEADLAAATPDQVVWRGIAEGLGYRHNTQPFARLADAAPWYLVRAVARRGGRDAVAGLLLDAAGLAEAVTGEELSAWRRSGYQAEGVPLPCWAWQRAALRPANDPVARCRGLATLAERFAADAGGPSEVLLGAVVSAARGARGPLWRHVSARPWIGRGRAQTIVVNVVLPFAAATGLGLAEDLFRRLPGEPPNEATRYMLRLLGGTSRRYGSACHRQGLLALFKTTCAGRLCERCPAADRARLSFAVG